MAIVLLSRLSWSSFTRVTISLNSHRAGMRAISSAFWFRGNYSGRALRASWHVRRASSAHCPDLKIKRLLSFRKKSHLGPAKATPATARKLACLLYHLLKYKDQYP